MTANIDSEIDDIIQNTLRKNRTELDMALIKPLTQTYQFCSNGLYIFCGRMGSGKTFKVMKHILTTERLFHEPYYSLIVFCSTSQGLDKTVQAFLPKVKSPIAFVPDTSLLPFLRKHIATKAKYYSIMRYINSNFKKIDDNLQHHFDKHHVGVKRLKQLEYVATKLAKYQCNRYPANLLLILDDFADHPLIGKKDSELNRLLTKSRHYNITTIITVQTTKFLIKNIKRICSDICLWRGIGEEDFMDLMKMIPHSFDTEYIWQNYKRMTSPNAVFTIHVQANTVEIEDGKQKQLIYDNTNVPRLDAPRRTLVPTCSS